MPVDIPPQVNVSVESTDNTIATQSAENKLKQMYPGYTFKLIQSTIINNKWTGLFSLIPVASDSSITNEDEKPKVPVMPRIIVIIVDHNKDVLKPYPHSSPVIVPLKLDDEDKKNIHWDSILNGTSSIVSGNMAFKYRTSTFAIWDTDRNLLTINQGQEIKQCELDNNKNEESEENNISTNSSFVPSREDIVSCIQDE